MIEVAVGDRIVQAYDSGPVEDGGPTMLWHHGTPGDRSVRCRICVLGTGCA